MLFNPGVFSSCVVSNSPFIILGPLSRHLRFHLSSFLLSSQLFYIAFHFIAFLKIPFFFCVSLQFAMTPVHSRYVYPLQRVTFVHFNSVSISLSKQYIYNQFDISSYLPVLFVFVSYYPIMIFFSKVLLTVKLCYWQNSNSRLPPPLFFFFCPNPYFLTIARYCASLSLHPRIILQ